MKSMSSNDQFVLIIHLIDSITNQKPPKLIIHLKTRMKLNIKTNKTYSEAPSADVIVRISIRKIP